MLLGHFAAVAISLILWGAGYNIYPMQFGATSTSPTSETVYKRDMAWSAMTSDAANNLWSMKLPTQSARSVDAMPIQLIYKSPNNCLTKSNLRVIQQLEQQIMNSSQYVSSFCLRQPDGTCRKPRSILRFFDGSYAGYGISDVGGQNVFRSDPNFDRISEIISTAFDANGRSEATATIAAGQPDLQSMLNYVVGNDFNGFSITSSVCRSMVFSGLPLAGFRTSKDQVAQQLQQLSSLHCGTFESFFADRGSLGDMEFVYHSDGLQGNAERAQRNSDYFLLIGSLLFLWIALWIQTQSLWLSSMSLFGAFGSYVWANLLYRIILNFFSYSDPQALSCLVVAVISSYHTVYFLQTFVRTMAVPGLTLEAQLSTALGMAHKHFLTVNSVVALSFFVCAASNFKTVTNFSVFCGLLAITSYLSACIFVPTVFATWAHYWVNINLFKKNFLFARFGSQQTKVSLASSAPVLEPRSSNVPVRVPMQNFFRKIYVDRFVTHPVLRWLLISAALIVVLIFLIAAAVQLRVDKNQPLLWREPTNFGKFRKYQATLFGQSDQDPGVRLYLILGFSGVDDSRCHRSDLTCPPLVRYSSEFDLLPHTAQNKLSELCGKLRSVDSATERALRIRRSATVQARTGDNPLEISCFMDAMQGFYTSTPTPLPSSLADMALIVSSNAQTYPSATYSSVGSPSNPESGTYYRHFEFGLLNWITNASLSPSPSSDFSRYSSLLGGTADTAARRSTTSLTYAGGQYNLLCTVCFSYMWGFCAAMP